MKKILLTICILSLFFLSGCGFLGNTTTKKSIIKTTLENSENASSTSITTTNTNVESKNTTSVPKTTVENVTSSTSLLPTTTTKIITNSINTETKTITSSSESKTTTKEKETTITSSLATTTKEVVTDESIIVLDDSNNPEIIGENARINYNDYEIVYSKVSESISGHVIITKGGSITNIDPFKEIESIEIEYQIVTPTNKLSQPDFGFGKLYYVTDDYKISNPFSYDGKEITTEKATITSPDGHFISFYSANTIEIFSLTIDYATGSYNPVDSDFTLNLIGTNDIHGQVNEDTSTSTTYASLDYMSSYISSERKTNKWNLILDQGDVYQGSIEQYLTDGKVMDDYLLINGYYSTVLGNHEWDYGPEKIEEYSNYSEVPLLANNVRDKNGNSPSWCIPYLLTEIHGVKIGLIGAIGNCKSSISYSMVKDYDFLVGDELTAELKKDSIALKAMGAEFIILQFHYGTNPAPDDGANSLDDYNVSELSGKYIDLVLEGHTENNYKFIDAGGVYHIQTSGHLKAVYDLKISVKANGNGTHDFIVGVPQFTYANTIINAYNRDPLMYEINKWYDENVYGVKTRAVATTNGTYMSSTKLKNTMAELYYNLGELVPKYDVIYGGGFLSTRSPGTLSSGTVTYGDIASIFPFDNNIYLCSISGTNLLKKFVNSGNTNYYGFYDFDESSIVGNKNYYIITDSYNTDYQNKNSTVLNILFDFTKEYGVYARDLLFLYLGGKKVGETEQLSSPALNQSGLIVSWDSINNANGYVYILNGTEYTTKDTQVSLSVGDKIKVMAVGDNEYYLDSNWSDILTVMNVPEEKKVLTSDNITYKDLSAGDTNCYVRLLNKDTENYSGNYLEVKSSPIYDKSEYDEFGIGPDGYIDIKSISGYEITSLTVKIYGTYDNFTFYDSNGFKITPTKTSNSSSRYIIYEIDGNYDEIIIKNETTYTVSVYYYCFDLTEK